MAFCRTSGIGVTSDGAESTGAALMGAGIPMDLLSGSETQRHPGLDWRSRVEVWRAV